MPYRWLLPTQIVFLAVMTAMTLGVYRRSPPLGTLSANAGGWIVWASYVYALGMAVRSIRYALATPERRGVLIPIVFHFVLAGFLFAYGSAAVIPSARSPQLSSRASGASRGICTCRHYSMRNVIPRGGAEERPRRRELQLQQQKNEFGSWMERNRAWVHRRSSERLASAAPLSLRASAWNPVAHGAGGADPSTRSARSG